MANRLPRAPAQPRTVSPRQARAASRSRAKAADEPTPEPTPEAPTPEAPAPEAPPVSPRLARFAAWLARPAAVWVAVLLGGALRVAHVISIEQSPLAERLILDHKAYDLWAQRIAAGDWAGHGIFWVDPLYSYALAAIYALLGRDLTLARGFNVELGVVNIWLAGALTRRVTGSGALGAVGAAVAALCLPLIHNEAQIEKATLTATLACGALLLLLRGTRRSVVGAGVLLGLGVLARGNLLLAIPAGALVLAVAPAPADAADEPPVSLGGRSFARVSLRRASRFTLAAVAVVGVLTLRNVLVADELVLTTANAGQNFYIGQQRANALGTYEAPSFVRPDPQYEQEDFRAEAARRAGHPLGDTATSRFWTREALREIAADPGLALSRTITKVRLTFHQFETPDNDDVELSAGFSPVLQLPLVGMGLLAPLALLGAIVAWRRSREARVVAGAVALYASTLALFFVVGRFRVPMVPPMIALAVAGAAWLVDRARARDWRRAGPAAAGLAVGLALCFVRTEALETLRVRSLAVSFNNLGAQQLEANDLDGAIRSYERAIDTAPSAVIGAMRTLGDLYLRQGRYGDAERVMNLVMEHKPGSPMGRAALVRLYEAMREDPRYRDDESVRQRLATAYREAGRPVDAARLTGGGGGATEDPATRARQLRAQARTDRTAGRWSEAIAEMQEVIRIGPYDEGDRYALGELMEQRATPQAMAAYWSEMVASDPKPQTSLYFWAIALMRQNDLDGAEVKLREALTADPGHEMSELRYCTLLERRGDLAGALRHCDTAVEIFPDFRGAHEARARILTSLGRGAEAEAARQTAARSDPNTIRRFRYWGSFLLSRGRYAAAAAELARAVEADPTDAEAARLLREARAHLGDGGAAR